MSLLDTFEKKTDHYLSVTMVDEEEWADDELSKPLSWNHTSSASNSKAITSIINYDRVIS